MNAPMKTAKLIQGATGDFEVIVGMEVHAQVTSKAKLFSGASAAFGGARGNVLQIGVGTGEPAGDGGGL